MYTYIYTHIYINISMAYQLFLVYVENIARQILLYQVQYRVSPIYMCIRIDVRTYVYIYIYSVPVASWVCETHHWPSTAESST